LYIIVNYLFKMLSIETESIISKLLLNLADNEKATEVVRQVLGEYIDFDAYDVFRYLDRENKSYIDEYDIVDFLK